MLWALRIPYTRWWNPAVYNILLWYIIAINIPVSVRGITCRHVCTYFIHMYARVRTSALMNFVWLLNATFYYPSLTSPEGCVSSTPFDWQSPGLNYLNTYFTYTRCHNKQRQNLKYSQTLLCTLMATRAWMVLQNACDNSVKCTNGMNKYAHA